MTDGLTEVTKYKVMLIYPDGNILDEELLEIPKVGDNIKLRSRNYYVSESHESVVEKIEGKWYCDWVLILSN